MKIKFIEGTVEEIVEFKRTDVLKAYKNLTKKYDGATHYSTSKQEMVRIKDMPIQYLLNVLEEWFKNKESYAAKEWYLNPEFLALVYWLSIRLQEKK